MACFARPVGRPGARRRTRTPLHPSIQRAPGGPAAGAAPTGHTGRQRRRPAGTRVRACSLAVAGVRHGETTGGSKACMHARASKAAAPCTSTTSRVSGDCWRPARVPTGGRAEAHGRQGTSGRAARSLVQAKRQGGDVARPAVPASFQCVCMHADGPPRALRLRSSGSAETTVSGGSRRGGQCSPKPQRPACSRTVLHEKARRPGPGPGPGSRPCLLPLNLLLKNLSHACFACFRPPARPPARAPGRPVPAAAECLSPNRLLMRNPLSFFFLPSRCE